MSILQEIYNFWGVKSQHIVSDSFTGYEPVYDQLNKLDKPAYNKDPAGTINKVFDIYRSINLVPIIYFTEKGLINAVREFKSISYNTVKNTKISLGNNKGQPLSRFLFPNMMTAEPKGRGSNSLKDRFYDDKKLKR